MVIRKNNRSDNPNSQNGYKEKMVHSRYGDMEIPIPQDRNSSFQPKVVPKRKKDIVRIADKIISMYAKGMTTRQISDALMDIYGFEVSEGFISDVTDRILPEIQAWQDRPLASVYPVLFIDTIHFHVRSEGRIIKEAVYIATGIDIFFSMFYNITYEKLLFKISHKRGCFYRRASDIGTRCLFL